MLYNVMFPGPTRSASKLYLDRFSAVFAQLTAESLYFTICVEKRLSRDWKVNRCD